MYTQCPECQTAFRVTAKVLQQAAGRVRCGGCGNAFNALQSLSEEMPGTARVGAPREDEALLETLSEMAGPDEVRIEDTGVEWQVIDETDPVTGQPADESPPPAPITEEMRFDDNTPLPDDFGEETEDVYRPPVTPQRRDTDPLEPDQGDIDDVQVDLALGEPDEWEDLLDEVSDVIEVAEQTGDATPQATPAADAATRSIPLEVEEELAAIHNELSAMPEQASAATVDVDAPSGHLAESDIELTGGHEPDALPLSEDTLAERILRQADMERLAGDAAEEPPDADAPSEEVALSLEPPDESPPSEAPIFDEEEISLEELDQAPTPAEAKIEGPPLESTGAFNAKIEVARRALEGEEQAEEDAAPANEEDAEDLSALDGILIVDQQEADGQQADEAPESVEASPQPEGGATETIELDEESEHAAGGEQPSTAASLLDDPSALFDEDSPEVETIVMEGDFINVSLEEKAREERGSAHVVEPPVELADTYARNRGMVRGGRRKTDPPGFGVIAAVVVLTLVLLLQIAHESRQTLSTYGAFNQTIGPVYRMLGSPVTPQWDVKGWQFQATNGAIDDAEQVLTIFSRIVNRSERPLPYPLVHVSLTDRWEEIIGSRVLEPNEYLAGDLDPSIPVAPGENFTAVITIESPAADATGFKLNVCYRVAEGRVRCATEDFKD